MSAIGMNPVTQGLLAFGRGVSRSSTVVALEWQRAPIDWHDAIGSLLKDVPSDRSGVYAIEGSQDACTASHILYIGAAGVGQSERSLRARISESLRRFVRETGLSSEPIEWSDTWNLVLRWAPLENDLVTPVERLLIRAHLPQGNSQEIVNRSLTIDHELVVLNAGRKGPLLPVVASYYFWTRDGWSTA